MEKTNLCRQVRLWTLRLTFTLILYCGFFSGLGLRPVHAQEACGVNTADVALMADRTGSLGAALADVRTATINLSNLILGVPGNMAAYVRFGGGFGSQAQLYQGLTSDAVLMENQILAGHSNHSAVGTNYAAALDLGRIELVDNGLQANCMGVFLSDGLPTNPGSDAEAEAAAIVAANNFKANCRLFTVGFLVAPGSPEQALLQQLASDPSDSYIAADLGALELVFQEIFDNINCDDGASCTEDTCGEGDVCVHTPNDASCDDGNPCTENSCDPSNPIANGAGCVSTLIPGCIVCGEDSDCDDGNVCTTNLCNNEGFCETINNNNPCDDGLFCNGEDFCQEGECTHSGDPCVEGDECADNCNEAANNCNDPAGVECTDDGNECTNNQCDGSGSCVPINNRAECDDGDACTSNDQCSGGQCEPGLSILCTDGIACTTDTCNPLTGTCDFDPNGCECAGDEDCDDDNPCTDDFCDPATLSCDHANNEASCDDGLFCNGEDVCEEGECAHAGDPCDEGAECANDCDEGDDTCNSPAGVLCLDDGNPCTDNQCNGEGDCVAIDNTADCNDGINCTTGDQCSNGACEGVLIICNDGIACTADACDEATGICTHDNSDCGCTSDADCDDGNPCTANSCNPETLFCEIEISAGSACDDGQSCTQDDTCDVNGICAGQAKECNDGNTCTDGSCNPATGECQYVDNGSCDLPECDDRDMDSVCDLVDNCVEIANTDQLDSDGNGVGDACEPIPQVIQELEEPALIIEGSGETMGMACSLDKGTKASANKGLIFFLSLLVALPLVYRAKRNN